MKLTFKTGVFAAAMLVATTLTTGAAWAESPHTSHFCKNSLIRGSYGFTLEGAKLGGPPGSPVGAQVGVALTEFDGQGKLSQIDAVTVNGILVSDFTHPAASGTYHVNSDCTGTFTIDFTDGRPPVNASFVIVGGGYEIDTVVTSVGPPGAEQQGIISVRSIGKRQLFE
jgi:hypothetical protein